MSSNPYDSVFKQSSPYDVVVKMKKLYYYSDLIIPTDEARYSKMDQVVQKILPSKLEREYYTLFYSPMQNESAPGNN